MAPLLIDFFHGAAEIQRFKNAFLHQCRATRGFHHGGCHVAGGDDRILWRGGGMHQVGFVEGTLIKLHGFRFPYQNLRGLR